MSGMNCLHILHVSWAVNKSIIDSPTSSLGEGVSTHPGDIIHGRGLASRTTTLISLGVAARGEATLALHPQGQGGLLIGHQYTVVM